MLESILSYITVQDLMWLIVALPMFGFIVCGLVSIITGWRNSPEPRFFVIMLSQIVALASFAGIILVWYILYGLEGASPSVITGPLISWKGFLDQPLEFGLKADQLSLSILFITALIGVAAYLYSVGFMSGKKRVAQYFSLLNLAYSSVLLLILTDSLFLFFVIWQTFGVIGLVFISRYFSDHGDAGSATIYYIIEIIAGAALLLVMFLIRKAFLASSGLNLDMFQFSSIQIGSGLLLPFADIICFALVMSIIARSLQFPLYVWMVSAGKAPLPVFAFAYSVSVVLVATYLLIRLNFLLVLSPAILNVIAIVGGIGCLFGSVIAVVQGSARKVVAYFAISQVGLAFIGIGVGAFATAVFHVSTYAIYVTSIIFGIGGVVKVVGHDSLEKMLGLRRYLPVTFWSTVIGVLAAVGIYPLSGFYSKNGIMWEAYQRGHGLLFMCAFISGILCTIALFRMVALLFFGKPDRLEPGARRPEETSVSILVVMVIVAFASIVSGWFGVSEAFGGSDHFREWLRPGLATQMVHMIGKAGRFSEVVLAVITTIFVAHAGLVTWIVYAQKRRWVAGLAERFKKTDSLLENGFYLNRFYEIVIARPLMFIGDSVLFKGLDSMIIDNIIVGGIGRMVELKSEIVGRFRATALPTYIFFIVIMLIILVGWSVF